MKITEKNLKKINEKLTIDKLNNYSNQIAEQLVYYSDFEIIEIKNLEIKKISGNNYIVEYGFKIKNKLTGLVKNIFDNYYLTKGLIFFKRTGVNYA